MESFVRSYLNILKFLAVHKLVRGSRSENGIIVYRALPISAKTKGIQYVF